ncbi:MAG TPA: universal stress protein [Candidatus Angelobacter sp.]|nr:universal stress protein [Candidatus Angelobacter sp.]
MRALEHSTLISFRNILYLTDFTPASEAAFSCALAFARHFNAHLYPAHAVAPYMPTELEVPVAPDILEKLEADQRAKLVELVRNTGLPSTVLVTREDIENAVPHWINEHGIDLIVMGTHARKGVDRMFLGSTAEAIVREATCPALTVGPNVSPQFTDELDFKKVLIATSLTKQQEPAVSYALSFARERGADITVLHVLPTPAETQEDWETLANIARDQMKELVPTEEGWPHKTEFFVEGGDTASRILEYASKLKAELIVLGLSQKPKTSTHFRRGVACKVIGSAPCAVLTVR